MQLAALESQKLQKLSELKAAQEELKSVSGNVNIAITFPIPKPYAHSYINDWGFPRVGNPSGHQGTDIFAQKGTPVIAVADGVISEQFGFLRIGGYRLHIIADNGVDYYYAHLNNDTPGTDDNQGNEKTAYAPGIAPGVRVKKGQIIGYVGDSGDAEPTPAHLHFGIIVNGQWVNPYPYLKAADWK
jgi:murein DD-endopeptidase MepM/ murein hydrolase activator NlpD